MKLQINKRAVDDLSAIFAYGLEQFGQQQAQSYVSQFQSHLTLLLANPLMGQDMSYIRAEIRRSLCNEHVIYYRITQHTLVVMRVLHGRQDPMRHL